MTSFKSLNEFRSTALINLTYIAHNLRAVKSLAPSKKICAMVKANAYGHGIVDLAHFLSDKVNYLGVAFLDEAIELRQNGVTGKIIVFSPFIKSQLVNYIKYNVDIVVGSVPSLDYLNDFSVNLKQKIDIHLSIDTGMMRIGIRYSNADRLLNAALKSKKLNVVSVFSHLATSDSKNLNNTYIQLERFRNAISFYDRHSLPKPLFHLANSAGILRLPETHFDMVRPGLMLYGYHPSKYSKPIAKLKPALSWLAQVVYFKVILTGQTVGYGGTWRAPHNVRAATIPIGYGDGFQRALSNCGEVLIRGARHRVIGNVCMDQTMILLDQAEAYVGDEVVIIGRQGRKRITADNIAAKLGSISNEVLTGISKRVPRVYLKNTARVKINN